MLVPPASSLPVLKLPQQPQGSQDLPSAVKGPQSGMEQEMIDVAGQHLVEMRFESPLKKSQMGSTCKGGTQIDIHLTLG